MAIWNSIGGALGRAYDYATPGKGSSRLTDWGGWGDASSAPAAPKPTAAPKPYTPPASSVTQDANWMKSLQDEIRRLQNSIAQTPRLPSFDIMANYRNAQSAAEKAVNPLYERKLNDFLAQNAAKQQQKRNEFALNLETIGQEKSDTLATNELTRTRTAEDTAAAIENINTVESNFQADEGEAFDTEYRQLAEQLAAEGAAQTGLGGQQSADQIRLRNVQSKRQLDEFQGQREAKTLFKTRTFEDLARGDTQAETLAQSKTKAAQFDLDSYLEDLAFDERNFRLSNDIERMGAVADEASRQEQLGVEQFLAGLPGQGFRPQDIAYARQVYA